MALYYICAFLVFCVNTALSLNFPRHCLCIYELPMLMQSSQLVEVKGQTVHWEFIMSLNKDCVTLAPSGRSLSSTFRDLQGLAVYTLSRLTSAC